MMPLINKFSALIYAEILLSVFIFAFSITEASAQEEQFYESDESDYEAKSVNLRTENGKLYAYIVLLYNENPHFVNLIQKGSIPFKVLGIEGFHVKEYKNYLKTLTGKNLRGTAQKMLDLYLEPYKYEDSQLRDIEKNLISRNIILKLSRDRNLGEEKLTLDYCIYGKKVPLNINHPFVSIKEKIYNIQPYIYYDELSTSNSTFYFDMIYINPSEVDNDFMIAKRVIENKNVSSLFFVGSRVTDDIKYCLSKAFDNINSIRDEIWKMFVIHELTHKILNNNYNNFDQVVGEELSLCSTIYINSHLGLAILYSYLNYNNINPHRIAAMNFVKFCAEKTGNKEYINNPASLKNMQESKLKQFARDNFFININELKKNK
jgi:hypothetical protein